MLHVPRSCRYTSITAYSYHRRTTGTASRNIFPLSCISSSTTNCLPALSSVHCTPKQNIWNLRQISLVGSVRTSFWSTNFVRPLHVTRLIKQQPDNRRHTADSDQIKEISFNRWIRESEVIHHVSVTSGQTTADIGYVHFGPPDGPLVLGIHGVPGSHLDFQPLFSFLIRAGFRVLILNYPGFGISTFLSNPRDFSNGTDDRAALTLKFLEALNINKVPVLLGFSGGGHLTFKLAAISDIFQSVVGISSAAHRPQQTARPLPLIQFLAAGQLIPFVEPVFRRMVRYAYKKTGFKVDDITALQTAVVTVARSDFPGTQASGEVIGEKCLPFLIACSKTDRIVEWKIPAEFARIVGVPEENFTYYDQDGQTAHDPCDNSFSDGVFKKALVFERGGHYVHRAHAEEIGKHILRLAKTLKES